MPGPIGVRALIIAATDACTVTVRVEMISFKCSASAIPSLVNPAGPIGLNGHHVTLHAVVVHLTVHVHAADQASAKVRHMRRNRATDPIVPPVATLPGNFQWSSRLLTI